MLCQIETSFNSRQLAFEKRKSGVQHYHIRFEDAALKFYKFETYKTLQETEKGLQKSNYSLCCDITSLT